MNARSTVSDRHRHSEAGDTLIEVLLAVIVLGLASVALLIAFSTSISASATHRQLATDNTVLATATQVTIANIQSQPNLFSCPANVSTYPGYGPSGITLPAPYAGKYTVLYATTNPVQYWNPSTKAFGTTCEANQPQLITISLQGTTYSNSFVVD
jgi:type II secretory pathway pseudopilin PulG